MTHDKQETDMTTAPAARFDRYLTVAEVARILRRSPRTIRDWIVNGCPTPAGLVRIEAIKLGRSWTIREDWLVLFEHRVRPPVARAALDLEVTRRPET